MNRYNPTPWPSLLATWRRLTHSVSPGAARLLAVLGILAGGLLVYGQSISFGFITFDDPEYVYENPMVASGLSWRSISWAFTTFTEANWHPVTWLSLMLDSQFYGLNGGGYHLTNVLLHLANCVLLFRLVAACGAGIWPGVLAAAFFAVHPLHVESVAWVTERKDVLSTFFLLLALNAYCAYARHSRAGARAWAFYGLALACDALGLMTKPMLVTVPILLWLLDCWPLRGLPVSAPSGAPGRRVGWRVLLYEKIPFAVLSLASSAITFTAQRTGGAVIPLDRLPLSVRLSHIPIACVEYLGKTFWPFHLAIFYPHPASASLGWSLAAAVLLVGISVAAIAQRRVRPWLLVGWLWFLVSLAPVIGLIQVGSQGIADRYAYVPHIGLFLALGCLAGEAFSSHALPAWVRGGSAALVFAALLACGFLARAQTALWGNGIDLFCHSLRVTGPNGTMYQILGDAYLESNDMDRAAACYQQSLVSNPRSMNTLSQLGYLEMRRGRWGEAARWQKKAISVSPGAYKCWNSLGYALVELGHEEAALPAYVRALQLNPRYAMAHLNLAALLERRGHRPEAAAHYEAALAERPDWSGVLVRLAWIRATSADIRLRDGAGSLALARRAVTLTHGNDAPSLDALGAACAELGRWDEAIRAARAALAVSTPGEGAEQRASRVALYTARQPVRE